MSLIKNLEENLTDAFHFKVVTNSLSSVKVKTATRSVLKTIERIKIQVVTNENSSFEGAYKLSQSKYMSNLFVTRRSFEEQGTRVFEN